ncbi:hypothetical protein SAMN05443246_2724 [Paenibacillus sp. GP183]|jgi:hypothetical protein|nr:hypothetical protein SAMN05443246_2724 [Paenibacillus sp. GP183]
MIKFLIGVAILCVVVAVFYISKKYKERYKDRKENEELAAKFRE